MSTHPDGPRPPADQGLTSLGLLMALVGSVMAPIAAVQLFTSYREAADAARMGDEPRGQTWLLLLLAAGVLRALAHRAAGIRLWRWVPSDPPAMNGITGYALAAAVHAMTCVGFVAERWSPSGAELAAVAAVALAWPAVLLAVTRLPRFRALGPRLPLAEDSGFEALAMIMAVLGSMGVVGALVILGVALTERPYEPVGTGLLLFGAGALVVRSLVHLATGVRALRGDPLTAGPAFRRYGDFGVQAAMAAGTCLLLWVLLHGIDLVGAASAVALLIALLAWPALVGRFVVWREGGDGDAGRVRRPSPDGGACALGWILLGQAAFSLPGALIATLGSVELAVRARALLGVPLFADLAWWALPLAAAQVWAALELLAVTPRRRLAASVWAASAVIATVALRAGAIEGLLAAPSGERLVGLAGLVVVLTPAVATLLLVNRDRLPRAIARIRRPAAAGPAGPR